MVIYFVSFCVWSSDFVLKFTYLYVVDVMYGFYNLMHLCYISCFFNMLFSWRIYAKFCKMSVDFEGTHLLNFYSIFSLV